MIKILFSHDAIDESLCKFSFGRQVGSMRGEVKESRKGGAQKGYEKGNGRSFYLAQVSLVWNLLLDPEEDHGVPLIKARHLVVGFHLVGKGFDVFFFKVVN